jgi:hypothetical protein
MSDLAKSRMRWLRWFLPGLVLVVGGCSKTEFLYRNADWFVERWTDKLVDLEGVQKSDWRVVLERMLAEHRESELPRLVGLLEASEAQASRGLTEPVIDCLMNRAEELYRRHARLAVDAAVPLLTQLSPGQVDHLEQRLKERNQEYRETYLSGDPQLRETRRAQRFTERIERWTGALGAAQQGLVTAATRNMPDVAEPWLVYREVQQGRLIAMLRAGEGAETLRSFLLDWWMDFGGRAEALVAAADATRSGTARLIGDLDRTLTPAQRATLIERLGELRAGLAAAMEPDAVPDRAGHGLRAC